MREVCRNTLMNNKKNANQHFFKTYNMLPTLKLSLCSKKKNKDNQHLHKSYYYCHLLSYLSITLSSSSIHVQVKRYVIKNIVLINYHFVNEYNMLHIHTLSCQAVNSGKQYFVTASNILPSYPFVILI